MSVSHWSVADSARSQEIWDDYLRHHDVSAKHGQTAGIEPATRRIWFGESIEDVIAQRDADGSSAPLFFERVGSPAYYRKSGHHQSTTFAVR